MMRSLNGPVLTATIICCAGLASEVQAGSLYNAKLAETARKQNETLPQKFGNGMVWLNVGSGDMRLTNFYRVPMLRGDPQVAEVKDKLYSDIHQGVCTDPHTRRMINEGVTFGYVYRDQQGAHLFEFSFSKRSC